MTGGKVENFLVSLLLTRELSSDAALMREFERMQDDIRRACDKARQRGTYAPAPIGATEGEWVATGVEASLPEMPRAARAVS